MERIVYSVASIILGVAFLILGITVGEERDRINTLEQYFKDAGKLQQQLLTENEALRLRVDKLEAQAPKLQGIDLDMLAERFAQAKYTHQLYVDYPSPYPELIGTPAFHRPWVIVYDQGEKLLEAVR